MTIDWITWGIWLVGFTILLIWIWVPLKEFRRLLAEHRKTHHGQEGKKS